MKKKMRCINIYKTDRDKNFMKVDTDLDEIDLEKPAHLMLKFLQKKTYKIKQ
jgi:hypothetical protein